MYVMVSSLIVMSKLITSGSQWQKQLAISTFKSWLIQLHCDIDQVDHGGQGVQGDQFDQGLMLPLQKLS